MDAQSAAKRVERELRELRHERFVALDESGRIVYQKDGGRDSVRIEPEDWDALKGRVCTHNHPTGWNHDANDPRRKGNSFSVQDLAVACGAEVLEMRAVAPGYSYSVRPPPQGWSERYYDDVLEPAYVRIGSEVADSLRERVRSGRMKGRSAEAIYYHEIMVRLSEELGLTYRRGS